MLPKLPLPPLRPARYEVIVRDLETGEVLLRQAVPAISLDKPVRPGPLLAMEHAALSRDLQDAGSQPPVAGRIEATPTELDTWVENWLAYLAAHGRSDKTIKCWRRMVPGDIRAAGWTKRADLNFGAVTAFLGREREARNWQPATYNAHLRALQSLEKHVRRVEFGDLGAAEGLADNSPSDGSRAANLDEVLRHMAIAYEFEQNDRRSRSPRTLYAGLMFAHGCREDDHWHWRWDSHLRLEAAVPHVRWSKGIQKNKRMMLVALAPELVERLKAWRDFMREYSTRVPTVTRWIKHPDTGVVRKLTLPTNPDAAGAPVFVCKPPTDVFRKDRERAEIPWRDDRGRLYSPHSARKFFKTHLITIGCPDAMSEFLMRHSPMLEGVYYDPALDVQAAWVEKLPRIWPSVGCAQTPTKPRPAPHRGNLPGNPVEPARIEPLYSTLQIETPMLNLTDIPNPLGLPIGSDCSTFVSPAGLGSACLVAGPSGPAFLDANWCGRFHADNERYPRASAVSNIAALLRATANLIEGCSGREPREASDGREQRAG